MPDEEYENDGPCEWFLLCTNDATMLQPHPILGYVPICDRCHALADPDSTPHR